MCSEIVNLAENCLIDNADSFIGFLALPVVFAVALATMVGVIILITDKG